ncbi:phosphoribosylpyrophosphate synthetase [Zeaxanthinibacter sp. PT1]|uniref:phosphoribosylpyrophosphate synthetase n=1 Tax=Zeaxanthinibacter TaxID=561554 RepID=UPI00234A807E|nr:phosphoribosylpyrophosphate synthetase [Zeaxanthinibacter sp. PT1]MDC6352496.1 phosphoribosylpyrophosphate synthetase [Zeaxanthinibacter sp. PT1]
MDKTYTSLSVAISALQEEGYTEDFNLSDDGLENKKRKTVHPADELDVVKHYRFEGMSNPADNTVLYVIETKSGEKGLLVDAYGAYSGQMPKGMVDKLKIDY